MLEGCGEKGTLLHCSWNYKLVQPLWKTVQRFLKKLKTELPCDPAIPLTGMYPHKTIIQKDTCISMFIATPFTIAKTWKQLKCPSRDEWIKKTYVYRRWYIYTMENYWAIKRTKIMPLAATRMQLEIIILSEVSQNEKDKSHTISLYSDISGI